jgi:N6-adenosine-specific RNA methylase IME4
MLAFHPYADLFPLIEGDEFAELVADIKANDLREKIVIWEDSILDGRNRYRAALAAGLIDDDDKPDRAKYFQRFVREVDGDPLKFVISKNLKRRHLNDDQRRMVAARLANMPRGRPSENSADCAIKLGEAARMVNVDEAGTKRARTIIARATPEIRSAVERGKLTVAAGVQASKLEPAQQREIAVKAADSANANVVRTVIKREARAAKERELGAKQTDLPQKKYGVIVADPEWRFEPYSRETGMDRAADNHYPTAASHVVAQRDVPSIAADDCVLFLWATIPMLCDAIVVMDTGWGFTYKSHYVWGKDKIGTGYWGREKHEILLIGTRGNPPAPAMGTQCESLIIVPRGEHSAKPEIFLEIIERYYPTLPKIELNRRGPARPGWDAWGNESSERITDDSGTNHQPNGADAAQPAASVSEPASADPQPLTAPVDAGSPSFSESDLPEIILPGKWATFEHVAGFVDLTSEVAGRAS